MPAAEKVRAIRKGRKVRPPKKWFKKMLRKVKRQKKYKNLPHKRHQKIAAGIWHSYKPKTQIGIITGKGTHNPYARHLDELERLQNS